LFEARVFVRSLGRSREETAACELPRDQGVMPPRRSFLASRQGSGKLPQPWRLSGRHQRPCNPAIFAIAPALLAFDPDRRAYLWRRNYCLAPARIVKIDRRKINSNLEDSGLKAIKYLVVRAELFASRIGAGDELVPLETSDARIITRIEHEAH
jgi:hypothetical protein